MFRAAVGTPDGRTRWRSLVGVAECHEPWHELCRTRDVPLFFGMVAEL